MSPARLPPPIQPTESYTYDPGIGHRCQNVGGSVDAQVPYTREGTKIDHWPTNTTRSDPEKFDVKITSSWRNERMVGL